MVKLYTVLITAILLSACSSTPAPIKVETVLVHVPVHVPVPDSLLLLEPPTRPVLPISATTYSTDYWTMASDISESFYVLKNYSIQLEMQNALYRSYILSIPRDPQK